MDRIDPEPPEPWLTVAELAILCGLLVIVAFGFAAWKCEQAAADLKRWFDETLGGPW